MKTWQLNCNSTVFNRHSILCRLVIHHFPHPTICSAYHILEVPVSSWMKHRIQVFQVPVESSLYCLEQKSEHSLAMQSSTLFSWSWLHHYIPHFFYQQSVLLPVFGTWLLGVPFHQSYCRQVGWKMPFQLAKLFADIPSSSESRDEDTAVKYLYSCMTLHCGGIFGHQTLFFVMGPILQWRKYPILTD